MPSCLLLFLLTACTSTPTNDPHLISTPTTQPSSPVSSAIDRGVAFLVQSQNPDGSWGTGRETRGLEIYSSVPGSHDAFRVAATALCVMALREAGEKPAHARGLEYLITTGQARRDTADLLYNTWAHTYALQALATEITSGNTDPRLPAAAQWHLDRLQRYETVVGGWNYYDFDVGGKTPSMEPTSFGTAAGLVALWEARRAGINVPQVLIDRALRRLLEMRLPNGAYLYSGSLRYAPRLPANLIRGSIGRMQSANYALWLWNTPKVGESQSLEGLEIFAREHNFIDMGRKRPYPHESWYQTAPYYYYFGHYYAALLLDRLRPEDRARHLPTVLNGVLPHQEPDGSWWDYAMWDYHKPYGTAFAIMTLLRCR